MLARNQPCKDSATCSSVGRHLEPDWKLLKGYPDSVLATFFDVFEDGRVDVLLLQKHGSDFVVAAVSDTQQYDAMFLKVFTTL